MGDSNRSRALAALTGAYLLAAAILFVGGFERAGIQPKPSGTFNSPLEAALFGALGGLVVYLLSFSSAGVLGLMYSSSLSELTYSSPLADLLVRASLSAPAVFGFSDFVSVSLAWRSGYAKSARSVLKFSAYAAAMGAASALSLPPRRATGVWWASGLGPLAAGTTVLAVPAWAYLRSGERSMRGSGAVLATSAAALLMSATWGAVGALAGVASGIIPWLVPRRLFSRGRAEIPPPPTRAAGSVAEEIAEVRRLIIERLAEGGL